MNKKPDNPFRLEPSKIGNPKLRAFVRVFRLPLELIFRFRGLKRIYFKARAIGGTASFPRRVLAAMGVTWSEGRGAGAEGPPIPESGPVVVVANHPFGGIEGVVMLAMMEHYRSDSKVMVNFMLSIIPELRKDFLFVNPFGGKDAKRENMKSMKDSLKWLEAGHVLVVFPAGEVSSRDRASGLVRDIPWSTTIARMARKTGAAVVPVFFDGDNGWFFNFAGRIHPRIRTMLLPHEFVNKRNRRLRVEFGDAIPSREMAQYDTDEKLTAFLRLRTYILADRIRETGEAVQDAAAGAPGNVTRKAVAAQAEIIPPVAPEAIADDIARLPAESLLCEGDGLRAYVAPASAIPNALREIGRLREITYRKVGEGTNSEIDLDSYDNYYLHLFLWHDERREIAGAYRLGLTDAIVGEKGVDGLYIRTCFKFGMDFIDAIAPAIELGRSFVREEYQRSFSPLMLLWKGICTYVTRNPRYECLFGPVSISNAYSDASKEIMMRSLMLSARSRELDGLVESKLAPKPLQKREWMLPEYDFLLADMDVAAKLVHEIEPDGRQIPILVKQYMKMGGKVVRFNVDPDFNYCIDGMVAIRVSEADPRMMRRYMGAEAFAEYCKMHSPERKVEAS